METNGKFLPIGTVVMLKGGKKRAMITGFCSVADNDKDTMFDYSGCIFPEGFLSSNQTCLFNHNQIDKIYHLGLIDEEEQLFKAKLDAFIKHMEETNNSNATSNHLKEETVEEKQPVQEESDNISSNINVFQTAPTENLNQQTIDEIL